MTAGMEMVSPSLLTRWTSLQRSDTSLSGKVARESNQQCGEVRKVINQEISSHLRPHSIGLLVLKADTLSEKTHYTLREIDISDDCIKTQMEDD